MAYDRAERKLLNINQSGGPNVSANSYNVTYGNLCTCYGANWVPFLSSSTRDTGMVENSSPAPNKYYPKYNKKIIGGTSLSNKAPRFPKSNDFYGPPSTKYDPYFLKRDLEEVKDKRRVIGYLYHCNVPFTLKGYGPTIPNLDHVGYDIDENGVSHECCYYDPDTTLGPAFYNVSYSKFCSCYKGCQWSKYSSRDQRIKEFSTPGVGTYCIASRVNSQEEKLNALRCWRKKNARSLRYLDLLERKAICDNFPAPNEYCINTIKCYKTVKKTVPKKLCVKKEKYVVPDHRTPGPNEYTDPRTALNYLIKPSCVKELNAFLTTAPRFRTYINDNPSPNAYNIPSFVDDIKKKISPYAVRKTAFDTSVPKILYYLPPDYKPYVAKKPCKCSYVPAEPEMPEPKPKPTSSFASKTKRFSSFKSDYDASCASYNVTPSLDYIKKSCPCRKVKSYKFLTTEKRFGKMTNFSVVEDKSYIKGLIYDKSHYKPWKENNTGTFTKSQRFKEKIEELPGPLNYTIHPVYGSSIYNKTYNVTLMKSNNMITSYQKYKMKLKKSTKPFLITSCNNNINNNKNNIKSKSDQSKRQSILQRIDLVFDDNQK